MKKHFVSFAKSPLGYLANFVASATCYLPHWMNVILFDWWLCDACELFTLKDGIQDDALF